GLIRWNNVSARVAILRIMQKVPVFLCRLSGQVSTPLASSQGAPLPLRLCLLAVCIRQCLHRIKPMWTDGPRILAAPSDGVLSHQILVIENLVFVPRCIVEDRAVGSNGVVDGLPEMPELGGDGIHQILARQLLPEYQRDFLRSRVSNRFRKNADDV